jgi:hypothetical protein
VESFDFAVVVVRVAAKTTGFDLVLGKAIFFENAARAGGEEGEDFTAELLF